MDPYDLINILIRNLNFSFAFKICQYLEIDIKLVYEKYAIACIKKIAKNADTSEEESVFEALNEKLKKVENFSFINLAKKAFKYNKDVMGMKFLENEKSILTKLPKYIDKGDWDKVLELSEKIIDNKILMSILEKILKRTSIKDFVSIAVKHPNLKTYVVEFMNKNLKDQLDEYMELLKSPEERPTTSEAYYNAIAFYSVKYLQTTSICSTLICFNSITPINQYFSGEKIKNFILSDEKNKTENYINTKLVKEAIDATNPKNFDYQKARLECLKLRMSIYVDRERMESKTEVDLNNFVSQLLPLLHKELNKFKGNSPPIGEPDESNESDVINKKTQQFITEYRSKISDQFYYLTKMVEQCDKCKKIIKYYAIINSLCAMYPDKTAQFLKKKNINVIDMFDNYHRARNKETKTY
jgi:hypothetical protein